jgi:hypothetical protein
LGWSGEFCFAHRCQKRNMHRGEIRFARGRRDAMHRSERETCCGTHDTMEILLSSVDDRVKSAQPRVPQTEKAIASICRVLLCCRQIKATTSISSVHMCCRQLKVAASICLWGGVRTVERTASLCRLQSQPRTIRPRARANWSPRAWRPDLEWPVVPDLLCESILRRQLSRHLQPMSARLRPVSARRLDPCQHGVGQR